MIPSNSRFKLSGQHFVWGLALIVLYFMFRNYIKNITTIYDEEAALVATFGCFVGVYGGRSLAKLWIYPYKPISDWWLGLLLILLISCAFYCALFATSLIRQQTFMYGLFLALPLFIFCVASGLLVRLIQARIDNQIQEAKVQAEHSQSELHLLQSQLSPHFLFNTLNNLYGISISQPDKTPTLLLKLSELLRYSVYDAKELFVPLTDELAYINNYIEFEKLRIGGKLALTTAIDNVTGSHIRIAPMLLIVFVENAFKHAKNTTEQKIRIDISLKLWGNSILFSTKNSFSRLEETNNELNKNSGLGLANVQKRLDLLYPNTYDLAIREADGFYTVELQLRIK
ncbi:histidine kinase [Spirosoma sp. BT702]|uniref:Histidine kinase n=1 Tax=Spirosoma profusum TaxID=2771354 RepID=A0A927AMS0_9BACT|nr:histidine kinase [Spirosoma profusum]MBD2700379.1 histidine kinase [Spirosoma profusum]